MTSDDITERVIAAAIEVHRHLGPGLLESTYETCLVYELQACGLAVARQLALPVAYKGITLSHGYRIDLLVESLVIVEVKSVHAIESLHHAQLLSYLKLSDLRVGLLINFNVRLLKSGLRRIVNEFLGDGEAPG
jgi:GxxExxY protein